MPDDPEIKVTIVRVPMAKERLIPALKRLVEIGHELEQSEAEEKKRKKNRRKSDGHKD
jgi:hypothetical protein